MVLFYTLKNIGATFKKHYTTLATHWTEIKNNGFKKTVGAMWNIVWGEVANEVGVTTVAGLVLFVIKEGCKSLVKLTSQRLFEFAVKYTFPRLARLITPALFIQTEYTISTKYFFTLIFRYPYADCADIIVDALKHAPYDLQVHMFFESVKSRSDYYTQKLIPPTVNNECIVALIKQNNMLLLAKVLDNHNLNFMVAAAAVLEHNKLLETFENRMSLSEVMQFIETENWRDHGIFVHNDKKNDLIAGFQNKLLMREISSTITASTQRRKM